MQSAQRRSVSHTGGWSSVKEHLDHLRSRHVVPTIGHNPLAVTRKMAVKRGGSLWLAGEGEWWAGDGVTSTHEAADRYCGSRVAILLNQNS